MKFDPSRPYNDLPDLPPDIDFESKEVLRKVAKARAALAELKGISETIPNPELLLNSILLQEAKDSSEIENIVTTHDSLYKAAILDDRQPENKEVIRYRQAVWAGFDMLGKRGGINTNTAIKVYQILMGTSAEIRRVPGITLKNTRTGDLLYTPPVGETLLRNKLDNVWWFVNAPENEKIDPLIRLATMHYQFESIHPFTDGNGRTGRILNVLFLVQAKLLRLPNLYHSSFIIDNKTEYYRLLRSVTSSNDWVSWIVFMLNCIEQTSFKTIDIIRSIHQLMETTLLKVRTDLPRLRNAKEIVEILFMYPYCKIDHIVDRGIAVRQPASSYLKSLEKIGVLQSESFGRHTVYRNLALWELLSKE